MALWREVHAFSQPLIIEGGAHEVVVSTPMRFANIMRLNAQGERELVAMRWSFAAKDDATPARPKHMHARCETIDKKPTFANAFANARGILMVHTFNEGEELPNGKTKQWVITPNDGQPIAIAVICEEWTNGTERLQTFIQVTTPANELISRITDRMPAILPRESWTAWLGETDASPAEAKALLQTFEDGGNWTMTEQQSSKPARPPKPVKPNAQITISALVHRFARCIRGHAGP
jgi:putative SOS response-associated peptidase YedK